MIIKKFKLNLKEDMIIDTLKTYLFTYEKILITGSSSRFAESLKKILFGENIFMLKTELDITKIDSIEENIKN